MPSCVKMLSCRFWFPCCLDPPERDLEDIAPYRSPLSEQLLGPKVLKEKKWIRPKADLGVYLCFFGIYLAFSIFYFMWMGAYFKDNAAKHVRNASGPGMDRIKGTIPEECKEMPDVFMAFFISCGLHLFFTLAQVACMAPRSCWYYVNKILRLCSLISTIGVCIWGVLDVLEETDLQCEHYIRTVGSDKFWIAIEQFEMMASIFLITACMANIVVADEIYDVMGWLQADPDPDMYLTEKELKEKQEQLRLERRREELEKAKEALKQKKAAKAARKAARAAEREKKRKERDRENNDDVIVDDVIKAEIAPRVCDPKYFHASRSRTPRRQPSLEELSDERTRGYGATDDSKPPGPKRPTNGRRNTSTSPSYPSLPP